MSPHTLATPREIIVRLFARARPTYTRAEAQQLLPFEDIEAARADGLVSLEPNDVGTLVIPWEDVATLALEEWTPRMIHAALDAHQNVIPHLNQHYLMQVSLPLYLMRLLDYLARAASKNRSVSRNASDIIEATLHGMANTLDTASIEAAIPGFAQALQYPYYINRYGNHFWRCRYCNVAITTLSCAVCQTCHNRHTPNNYRGENGLPELDANAYIAESASE